MTDRATETSDFLDTAGWANAARVPLAGDASMRRYERVTDAQGNRAVLMDADPAKGETTAPFLHIARVLTDNGFSAPKILAQDTNQGLLLLEDLGDDLFARVTAADPDQEIPLYQSAAEMLHALHQITPPPGLTECTPDHMADLADLVWDHYAPRPANANQIHSEFRRLLATHTADCSVLILRDFHAENLIWLPDGTGPSRVGLLDFQDAMAGHPAYDLVSLLQDARRDLQPGTEQKIISHFLAVSDRNRAEFSAAYATLGAQRNLRILGVFARLAKTFGKPHYIDLIPRVWSHLQTDLAHPSLGTLRGLLAQSLPDPTPDHLQALRP